MHVCICPWVQVTQQNSHASKRTCYRMKCFIEFVMHLTCICSAHRVMFSLNFKEKFRQPSSVFFSYRLCECSFTFRPQCMSCNYSHFLLRARLVTKFEVVQSDLVYDSMFCISILRQWGGYYDSNLRGNKINGTLNITSNYSGQLKLIDLQNNSIDSYIVRPGFSFQIL